MVRSAAEQRHARVGRDLHALVAGAARAARRSGLTAFYADAAAVAELDAAQREERLRAWEARAPRARRRAGALAHQDERAAIAALNLEKDRAGALHDGNRLGQRSNPHAIDLGDDVAGTQAAVGGGAVRIDARDEQAGDTVRARVLDDLGALE